MIPDLAILIAIPVKTAEFEANFETTQEPISSAKRCKGHQLQKCHEVPNWAPGIKS